jgi:hypothetical protein
MNAPSEREPVQDSRAQAFNSDAAALPPADLAPGAAPLDAPLAAAPLGVITYNHGRWGSDSLPIGATADDSLLSALQSAGFQLLHEFGLEDAAISLELFSHAERDDYIISVRMADKASVILLADLPNLFKCLGELLPVVEASHRLEIVQEQFEQAQQQCKRRRNGAQVQRAEGN